MKDTQHIIILGGEIAGPMAAAYLGQHLPKSRFKITFVESENLRRPEWFATSHADLRKFNRALKIGEVEFVRKCRASFKLGEDYQGWGPSPYTNSFVAYGATIGGIEFIPLMLQQGRLSTLDALCEFSLPVQAARAGKFLPPDAKGRPILSDYDYGYHLDPIAYADLLTQKAKNFGVSVVPSNTALPKADLIINASGQSNEQSGEFINWTDLGFGGSYSSRIQGPQSQRLSLTTKMTTTEDGWNIYGQTQTTDFEIEVFFNESKGDHTYVCGRLESPWVGNTLSIGGAAITIEPIMGSPLRLIQHDLERLIKIFPPHLENAFERQEYNRLSRNTYDRVRDYHVVQYKTATAPGATWDKRRQMVLPKTAQYKLDLFKARGHLVNYDEDQLHRENWMSLFVGQQTQPERYNALADTVDQNEIDTQLASISALIEQTVSAMPTHEDFILKHCPADGFNYSSNAGFGT